MKNTQKSNSIGQRQSNVQVPVYFKASYEVAITLSLYSFTRNGVSNADRQMIVVKASLDGHGNLAPTSTDLIRI